ncbi:hypothetical protein SCUCBS95973_004632 [Sporothrix curviconia]|uniref:Aldehyde dehydrogenase domain-containing protein n=1 Tax=Sporothrix curviconia TaxID=1260050 RepID=A0ABP0BQF4_9PEZI
MANNGQTAGPVPLLINNEDVVTETQFDVCSPATGQTLHCGSSASLGHVDRAVAAARAAFPAWKAMRPYARRDLLFRAADAMLARQDEFVRYQMDETGAARPFVEHTFLLGVSLLRDFAARIPSIEGSLPAVAQDGEGALVWKEPYGVVLAIAPWNAPFILGVRAVAIPLAAGNTTILKGSELAPRCFWAIGDAFREAGLPAGCLNVVYHRPADAAAVTTALIAHPLVRKISFTGSTHVGAIVAAMAGEHTKPVLLELGGKASAIVLDDADLQRAATQCIEGAFKHSGQICMTTERIVVQRKVADEFRRLLVATADQLHGDTTAPPVLVNEAAVRKCKGLVADAVAKGARLLFGQLETADHNAIDAPDQCRARMRPVVVDNTTPDMALYATESFGPIVSLFVVDTEEEAISLANDTEYGLTAAVFTRDLLRGFRVAKALETGAVHINGNTVHDEPVLPHGGWKSSGYGRFGGTGGYDEFLQTKTVTWAEK